MCFFKFYSYLFIYLFRHHHLSLCMLLHHHLPCLPPSHHTHGHRQECVSCVTNKNTASVSLTSLAWCSAILSHQTLSSSSTDTAGPLMPHAQPENPNSLISAAVLFPINLYIWPNSLHFKNKGHNHLLACIGDKQ